MVKNYLWVFVNCLIENPSFDSQVCTRARGVGGGAIDRSRVLYRRCLHARGWSCSVAARSARNSLPLPLCLSDQGHADAALV